MAKRKECFWKYNLRSTLAWKAKIQFVQFSDIIHRKRGVSKERAIILAAASKALGLNITFEDWLFNKTTKHPAFFGKPISKK